MGASTSEKIPFSEHRKKIVRLIELELEARNSDKETSQKDTVTLSLENWSAAVSSSTSYSELPSIFTDQVDLESFEGLPIDLEEREFFDKEINRAVEYSVKTEQDAGFLQKVPDNAVILWEGIFKVLEKISTAKPITVDKNIPVNLRELRTIATRSVYYTGEDLMNFASSVYKYQGAGGNKIADILKLNNDCIELSRIARSIFDEMNKQGMPQT